MIGTTINFQHNQIISIDILIVLIIYLIMQNTNERINFSNPKAKSLILKNFKSRTIQFLIFIAVSIVLTVFITSDRDALSKRSGIYTFLIVAPLFAGLYLSTQIGVNIGVLKGAGLLITCILIFSLGSYYSKTGKYGVLLVNVMFYAFTFLIIIVGMAVIYNIFRDTLLSQTGNTGFMIQLLFFIPCLVSDFIEYIRDQLQITSPIVVWLLVLEIILLLLYTYMPNIIRALTVRYKNVLYSDAIYLDQEIVIAEQSRFLIPVQKSINGDDTDQTYRNSNYAFSFWVYVNPGGPSTSSGYNGIPARIFMYGNTDTGGKPQVMYEIDSFLIYFAGINVEPYRVKLPNQKWLHFAFNYHTDHADFFVNGEMNHTYLFDEGIPPPGTSNDVVIIGQKADKKLNVPSGVKGSIRDVRYYESVLSMHELSNLYNIGYQTIKAKDAIST